MHPAEQIAIIIGRIYRSEMTTTSGGNLSIMDENGDMWITPAAIDKGSLTHCARAELQGLESLVGVRDVVAGHHHAVVLHDHGLVVRILLELRHDLLSEKLAARKGILSEAYRAARRAGLRNDARVRNLVYHAESHQSRRVGVYH